MDWKVLYFNTEMDYKGFSVLSWPMKTVSHFILGGDPQTLLADGAAESDTHGGG